MNYTVDEAVAKMLDSYEAYYNIHLSEDGPPFLVARCDFFSKTEGSMLVKNDVSWQYTSEEFLFLCKVDELTADLANEIIQYAHEQGSPMMHIGPRHMYSYITPVIICNKASEEAKQVIKKCRISKSFQFSLHGWMEVHTAVLEVNHNIITTNRGGKSVGKVLKSVLYHTKRRRFLK